MTRNVVVAVDATERSLDPLALGKLLVQATHAPAVLVTVFPYHPLADPSGDELTALREEARDILLELAQAERLEVADVRVVAGNFAARELQRVTEQDTTGLIVVGSTHRGRLGRLLPGGVGERLLAGSACPVALAPRGYADQRARRLERIGVAFDGSDESRHALEAGRVLARGSEVSLRVISVFQHLAFGAVATGRTGGASVNQLLKAELREALENVVAESPEEPTSEGVLLEGSPGEVLATQSAELDLLVTGSRGYGPRAAVMLGSTTHALMRNAACPGLVLPRGTNLDLGQAQ